MRSVFIVIFECLGDRDFCFLVVFEILRPQILLLQCLVKRFDVSILFRRVVVDEFKFDTESSHRLPERAASIAFAH